MADQLSASELRKQYHAGGSIPDSELSASQLRARNGIQSNRTGAQPQGNNLMWRVSCELNGKLSNALHAYDADGSILACCNPTDFSTAANGEGGGGGMLIAVLALVVAVCAVLYFLNAGRAVAGKHDEL